MVGTGAGAAGSGAVAKFIPGAGAAQKMMRLRNIAGIGSGTNYFFLCKNAIS
jgi:hypothetical protein